MENEALLDHVADIVSAHVSNNAVAVADLPGLIQAVYASLTALGQASEPVVAELKPAVSVRSSVKPDAVTCLECGEKMKMLKRHLGTEHGLTPAEYRTRWGLPGATRWWRPTMPPSARRLRSGSALAASPARARKPKLRLCPRPILPRRNVKSWASPSAEPEARPLARP